MKLIDDLAAGYWIDNTKRIYEEDLHVSAPVMDAYKSGFGEAIERCINILKHQPSTPYTAKELIEIIKKMKNRGI
jgi:hypothetical protein